MYGSYRFYGICLGPYSCSRNYGMGVDLQVLCAEFSGSCTCRRTRKGKTLFHSGHFGTGFFSHYQIGTEGGAGAYLKKNLYELPINIRVTKRTLRVDTAVLW